MQENQGMRPVSAGQVSLIVKSLSYLLPGTSSWGQREAWETHEAVRGPGVQLCRADDTEERDEVQLTGSLKKLTSPPSSWTGNG